MPKVSIIMATYNQEDYIAEAIKSIIDQTFSDFELVIIEDASTDRTKEIIGGFLDDKRIKLITNNENHGLIYSLNKGLANRSDCKYVARMDSDDTATPTRLERQTAFMDENLDTGLIGSNVHYFGNIDKIRHYPVNDADIKTMLVTKSSVAHTAAMFRNTLGNLLEYDSSFPKYEDYALWISLINETKFYNVDEVLMNYRRHDTNITNISQYNIVEDFDISKRLLEKYGEKVNFVFSKEELDVIPIISSRIRFTVELPYSIKDIKQIIIGLIDRYPSNIHNYKLFSDMLMTRFFLYLIGRKKYYHLCNAIYDNLSNVNSLYNMYKDNKNPV